MINKINLIIVKHQCSGTGITIRHRRPFIDVSTMHRRYRATRRNLDETIVILNIITYCTLIRSYRLIFQYES